MNVQIEQEIENLVPEKDGTIDEINMELVSFLNSLLFKSIDQFDNIQNFIKDNCKRMLLPYRCRGSNLKRATSYSKYECQFCSLNEFSCHSFIFL